MKRKKVCILAGSVAVLFAWSVSAESLVKYSFSDVADNVLLPSAADSTGSQITASSISNGTANVAFKGEMDRSYSDGHIIATPLTAGGVGTGSINTEDWITFTLTPESGKFLSFTAGDTLGLDLGTFFISGNSGTTTVYVALYTSKAGWSSLGGADQVGATKSYTFSTAAGPDGSMGHVNIDISSLGSIAPDTALEFRLYAWRDTVGTGSVSGRYFEMDNIEVKGAVKTAVALRLYSIE